MKCAICEEENAKKCTACGNTAYCSTNHQRQHWSKHKSDCKSWKITKDPKNPARGRFLAATRKIKPGEIIFRENPTVVGPRTLNPTPVCPGCYASRPKSNCSECGIPVCAEKCQNSAYHQMECPFLVSKSGNADDTSGCFNDYDVLAPLRFLLRKQKDPERYKQMKNLVGHIETKKQGPDWSRISETANRIAERYTNGGKFKLEEIQEAICILDSNSYQLFSKTDLDSLCGLYINASMLNHRCFKANTRPVFVGKDFEMKIVAIDEIETGEEITTSYVDSFKTTLQRRAILYRQVVNKID